MEVPTLMTTYGKHYLMRLAGITFNSETEDMRLSYIWSQQLMEQKNFIQMRTIRLDMKLRKKLPNLITNW